jgi:hypothetical protein
MAKYQGGMIGSTANTTSGTNYTGRANGVFSLPQQIVNKQLALWAIGQTKPNAPSIGTATGTGATIISVAFIPPVQFGGSPITTYTVTSSGGQTATGSSSPIVVSGLTTGVSYTFIVTATNALGTSDSSGTSNSAQPAPIGSLSNPADSIATLRSAGITTNGMYYFKNALSGATTFQAYCKFNYIDGNDWYLLLKVHNQGDMTSGSTYWTNTSLYNETDSNLTSGTWSKYATWNYVPFTRVMMEMTQGGTAKIPPIMIYNTSRTFAQAITAAGTPVNGAGLLCNSTDPVMPANARYWGMTMKSGTNFTDANGAEDYIQGYGIGTWAGNSQNSTTAEGFPSIGIAGAWIGCPLDEGTHTFNIASNSGADSGFGFGGGCGNSAKTFSAGYAEWSLSASANTLPGYVWVR